jgi:hypothetical protein
MKWTFLKNKFSARVGLLMSVAVIGCALGASPAGAAWTNKKVLSKYTYTNLPTNTASVALSPNGDGLAVWINESNNFVQYAEMKAGVWTPTQPLYRANVTKGEMTSDARVVIDPQGNATAIFASTIPGALQYCVAGGRVYRCKGPDISHAKVLTRDAGATTWSAPTKVSLKGVLVSEPRIAVDQAGNVTATWKYQEKTGMPPVLQATSRPQAGVWSAIQTLQGAAIDLANTCLAVGGAGDVMVAWQEKSSLAPDAQYLLRSVSTSAGNAWGPTETISAQTTKASTLDCAMDAHGDATLVWDDDYSAMLAHRALTSGWQQPVTLTSGSGRLYGPASPFMAYSPTLATSDQGDILVSWLEYALGTGEWSIEAQTQLANGQTGSISLPTSQQYASSSPTVTMSPDGSLGLVAWVDNGALTAYSASFTPTTGWSDPLALGTATWDTNVVLGSGPGASALGVWMTGDVTRYLWKVMGATYTP